MRNVVSIALAVIVCGLALATQMTRCGVVADLGPAACLATGVTANVSARRWPTLVRQTPRRVVALLSASSATGQLLFLPRAHGYRPSRWRLAMVPWHPVFDLLVLVLLVMRDIRRHGAAVVWRGRGGAGAIAVRRGNALKLSFNALATASRDRTF